MLITICCDFENIIQHNSIVSTSYYYNIITNCILDFFYQYYNKHYDSILNMIVFLIS